MGSDNYDLSDLEDVLLPWAADLRISDAALADLCRRLANKLLDTSHGEALVPVPSEGLVVRGVCDLETRHAMWWRGVLLETGLDVFDAQAEFGSRWSAEYGICNTSKVPEAICAPTACRGAGVRASRPAANGNSCVPPRPVPNT